MKVLVLGGSGFLGSYVVDELIAAAHNVVSFDRSHERFRPQNKNVEYCQADLGNRGELDDVLAGGVEVVVHLVSSTIPQSSNDDPIFDVQSNLVESIALFEMCVKHKVRKVVFVSSGGTIYGSPNTPIITEDHPTLPVCSYGIVKLAIENYLRMFYSLSGLQYHVLRLSNPFGSRQDPRGKQGAAAVFMFNILNGKEVSIWGDGSVVRDFIHVSDFARACIAAIYSEKVGVLNIGSGVGLSIKELLAATEKVVNLPAKVNWLPSRSYDVSRIVLDCELARKELGWIPSVSLESGLFEMKEWMSEAIYSRKL